MDFTENNSVSTPQSSYDPQKTAEEQVREKSKEVITKLENEFSGTGLCQRRYRVILDQNTGKTIVNETYAILRKPLLEENNGNKVHKRLIVTEFGMRVLKTTDKFEEAVQGRYGGILGRSPDYWRNMSNPSEETLQLGDTRSADEQFTLNKENGEYGTLERATAEDIKNILQYTREEAQRIREKQNREREESIANAPQYVPEKTQEEKQADDLDALNSIDF